MKNVNFNRDHSSIETVGIDGSSTEVQINVDVTTLKMYALLMCKGTHAQKAAVFFDIVIGMEGKKEGLETITWNQSRLVTGLKKLIFFSEIFPKKY